MPLGHGEFVFPANEMPTHFGSALPRSERLSVKEKISNLTRLEGQQISDEKPGPEIPTLSD